MQNSNNKACIIIIMIHKQITEQEKPRYHRPCTCRMPWMCMVYRVLFSALLPPLLGYCWFLACFMHVGYGLLWIILFPSVFSTIHWLFTLNFFMAGKNMLSGWEWMKLIFFLDQLEFRPLWRFSIMCVMWGVKNPGFFLFFPCWWKDEK